MEFLITGGTRIYRALTAACPDLALYAEVSVTSGGNSNLITLGACYMLGVQINLVNCESGNLCIHLWVYIIIYICGKNVSLRIMCLKVLV